MGAWGPMGAWSGATFCGSPGNACFVFAFVSTITSELGLEEMQPERVTADKQITAILNLRSIAKQHLICKPRNFPAAKLLPQRPRPNQLDYFSDSASKRTS